MSLFPTETPPPDTLKYCEFIKDWGLQDKHIHVATIVDRLNELEEKKKMVDILTKRLSVLEDFFSLEYVPESNKKIPARYKTTLDKTGHDEGVDA